MSHFPSWCQCRKEQLLLNIIYLLGNLARYLTADENNSPSATERVLSELRSSMASNAVPGTAMTVELEYQVLEQFALIAVAVVSNFYCLNFVHTETDGITEFCWAPCLSCMYVCVSQPSSVDEVMSLMRDRLVVADEETAERQLRTAALRSLRYIARSLPIGNASAISMGCDSSNQLLAYITRVLAIFQDTATRLNLLPTLRNSGQIELLGISFADYVPILADAFQRLPRMLKPDSRLLKLLRNFWIVCVLLDFTNERTIAELDFSKDDLLQIAVKSPLLLNADRNWPNQSEYILSKKILDQFADKFRIAIVRLLLVEEQSPRLSLPRKSNSGSVLNASELTKLVANLDSAGVAFVLAFSSAEEIR